VSERVLVETLHNASRTLVMGVVNVTPDSFSDGGQWFDRDVAVAHARHLLAQGADIVDVGGESTRPGAEPVPVEEEIDRVLPVVEALVTDADGTERRPGISVDTVHARTARAAVEAGASIINDVSGGTADPQILAVAAETGANYILQHRRGTPETMNDLAVYDDVVSEVRDELAQRLDAVVEAGVPAEHIVLDPGLGFAKNAEHNWTLLAHLDRLADLGRPLLIGASRKRFLATVVPDRLATEPLARDNATAAVTAIAAAAGVWGVRVHEVTASLDAARVAAAWVAHR